MKVNIYLQNLLPISTISSLLSNCFRASSKVAESNLLKLGFVTLPQVSQRILGGDPNRHTKSTKSLSLVMIIAFSIRAAAKISESLASLSPRSRKAKADRPKFSCIHSANVGGN